MSCLNEKLAKHDVHGCAQYICTMQQHAAIPHLIDFSGSLEVNFIQIGNDVCAARQGGQMPSEVWDWKG